MVAELNCADWKHRLILNSVTHTHQVITYASGFYVCSNDWNENVYSIFVSGTFKGSISDHGLGSCFWASTTFNQVRKSPYSTILAPCNFFLFKNQIPLERIKDFKAPNTFKRIRQVSCSLSVNRCLGRFLSIETTLGFRRGTIS